MVANVTASQVVDLVTDNDGDGVADPGDVLGFTVTITNAGPDDATNVQFSETLSGVSLVDQPGEDINVSPIAFDDSYEVAGNINVSFDVASGVFDNDIEIPQFGDSYSLSSFQATSAGLGTVSLNADGSFSYQSAAGFTGTDTFTYTITDDGLDGIAGNGDDLTSTATVTIEVGPSVWFIDNTAGNAAPGTGTQDDPFTSIAAFNAANAAAGAGQPQEGDVVYLRSGTYTEADGINLADGQTLVGEGEALIVDGVTYFPAGTAPTIIVTGDGGEGVELGQNNTISGLNIDVQHANADGISDGEGAAGGTVGTLTISNVSISGAGQAIDIDEGGTLAVSLASVTSTNATEEGIQLGGVGGTFTVGTVSLGGSAGDGIDLFNTTANITIGGGTIGTTDANGIGVDIAGGTGAITIGAAITKSTAGDIVEVSGRTGGTVTFSGNLTSSGGGGGIDVSGNSGGTTVNFTGAQSLSTGANAAVSLANNTGATVNFNSTGNGLDITTTSGSGFSATGGGTVNVTGAGNTISSGTGTALNISSTNIGVNDVTFQSISSNGAVNGIVLNNTGSSGGLIVTGDGGTSANGSGGTILNSTGTGISLIDTRDVALDQMNVTGSGDDGIYGAGVVNFTLNRSNINNNGNSTADEGIQFGEFSGSTVGVTGTVQILNSSVSGNAHNNVHFRNTSGTIDNLTVTNSIFNDLNDSTGANSFLFEASGTSTITEAFITGSTFANNSPQRALEVQAHDNATISDFVVSGNTFNANGIHASFTQDTAANLEFYFIDNDVTTPNTADNVLQAVNVFSSSQSTGGSIVGTISDNTIDTNQESISGISIVIQGRTDSTLLIDNNDISGAGEFGNRGIEVAFRGPTTAVGPQVTHDITITNNVVDNVTGQGAVGSVYFPLAAISVEADNQSGSFATAPIVRADIRGNVVPNTSAFDLTSGNIQFYEYDGDGTPGEGQDGIGQLVDSGAPSADADAQLSSTNTGSADAVGIDLISGPINIPQPVPTPLLASPGASTSSPVAQDEPEDTATGQTGSAGSTPPADDADGAPIDDSTGDQAPAAEADDGLLSQAELDAMVDAAIEAWVAAGLTPEQAAVVEAVTFSIEDMPGQYLGAFQNGHVTLDLDGAGYGWFVDTTPGDNSEFTITGTIGKLVALAGGDAAGRMDLFTTILHELGHALGLADLYGLVARGDLMYGYLTAGERRLPTEGQANDAVAGSIDSEAFIGGPVVIGDLPAGKSVTIQWQATVDEQDPGLIEDAINQGTVEGDNFATAQTNSTTTAIDSLTLGGTIWNDADFDGLLDLAEGGFASVDVRLYVDDGDGVLDGGDTLIDTTTTDGFGVYEFAGLAPGSYIVAFDRPAGFAQNSPYGGDPDDNVDDDSNATGGAVVSSEAIDLDYNEEPTPGTGNDTNTTLDFGIFNEPPTLDNLDGDNVTYVEDDAFVLLDLDVDAFVDDDADDFGGGSLTVEVTTNEVASEDQIAIDTSGTVTLSAGLTVGSQVEVAGVAIGTILGAGGAGTPIGPGDPLTIAFLPGATPERVQALVRALAYTNANTVDPATDQRTVEIVLTDSAGVGTTVETSVDVVAINDEPALTATPLDPTFTEGDAAVDIFSSVDASTVEAGQAVLSFAITVDNVSDGADELLSIDGTAFSLTNGTSGTTATNAVSVSISVSGGTATVTVSKPGGIADTIAEAIIDGIAYENTSNNPTGGDRTITVTQIQDDGGTADGGDDTGEPGVASTVSVVSVNDQPVFEGALADGDETVTIGEHAANGTPIFDVDANDGEGGATDAGLTYSIVAGNLDHDGDGNLAFAVDPVTGQITVNDAKDLDFEGAASFTLTVQADDGGAANNTSTASVTVNLTDLVETFVVTTTDDENYDGGTLAEEMADGALSLREAIGLANAGATSADTITFAAGLSGGTITLDLGELQISSSLTIDGDLDGNGTPDITVSGNDSSRVFLVVAGTSTIEGLGITGGNTDHGAGVVVFSGGNLTIANSEIYGNQSSGLGGGIFNDGVLVVANSTIAGNTAFAGGGLNNSSNGSLTLVNATVSGNAATQAGGGIWLDGNAEFVNVTVTGNSALVDGGGVYFFGLGTLSLGNSIIAGNAVGIAVPSDLHETGATLVHAGGNIIGGDIFQGSTDVGDVTLTHVFDTVGADPNTGVMAGLLADNGGAVRTILLKAYGLAHNAGTNGELPADTFDLDGDGDTTETLPVDARGLARIFDGIVDLGAVELQVSVNTPPVLTGDLQTSVAEGGTVVIGAADLGFTDAEDGAADVTFTVSAQTNGALLVNSTAATSFTGTQLAAGQVSFRHDGSETTAASFNVVVEDGNEDGSAPVAQSFDITVTPVNDAPVNAAPSAQTMNEDTQLVFSTANGNALSVSDADAGSGGVLVTLSVSDGRIGLSGTSGLTFVIGTGIADTTMTFRGSIADVNAALDGLVFAPDADFAGAATLSMTTNDEGRTGAGGAKSDTDTVAIDVTEVNDPPTLNPTGVITVEEGGTEELTTEDLGYSDVDDVEADASFTVTGAENGAILVNGSPATSFTGAQLAAGQVSFRHDGSETTAASFEITVDDGSTTVDETFDVVVVPVNDAPSALDFGRAVTSLPENTSTAKRIRVADLDITDVDGGNNTLRLAGRDAAKFAIANGKLFLKKGTKLNFEAKQELRVNVLVDDPTIDGAKAELRETFTLAVTDVNEPPSVKLAKKVTKLSEDVSTAKARKVADIVVRDDALGVAKLSLAGADSKLFAIKNGKLVLKKGVDLDGVANPKLDVTVRVNDPATKGIDDKAKLSIRIDGDSNRHVGTPQRDTMTGDNDDEIFLGRGSGDTIRGKGGDDRIFGGGGDDVIFGGKGDDILVGGPGVDLLIGGKGDDSFVFTKVTHSGNGYTGFVNNIAMSSASGEGERDIIADFTPGADTINLKAIDANSKKAGNQAFQWHGNADFAGKPRDLFFKQYDKPGTGNDVTIVYADVNGDGLADMQIELAGLIDLRAADFVL